MVPGLLARAEPAARLAGAAQRSELLCGPSTPHTLCLLPVQNQQRTNLAFQSSSTVPLLPFPLHLSKLHL